MGNMYMWNQPPSPAKKKPTICWYIVAQQYSNIDLLGLLGRQLYLKNTMEGDIYDTLAAMGLFMPLCACSGRKVTLNW